MHKYIIYRGVVDRTGIVLVQVLRHSGYEQGIPCYECYKTCKDFPAASDLVIRLERKEGSV